MPKHEVYTEIKNGGEAALTSYRVLRDLSFASDIGPDVIVNDYFLKAVRGQEMPDLSVDPTAYCLVKIVAIRRIPQKHRNMLFNESGKVMRHFAAVDPFSSRIHRVLDIFLLNESHLYMFFENLHAHKSLHTVVHGVPKGFRFPPPARAPEHSMLTLAKVQIWMRELAQMVEFLAYHGLAHRYIRPEYLFVNEHDHAKVGLLPDLSYACELC